MKHDGLQPDDPLLTERDAGSYLGGKSRRWMQLKRQRGGGPAYLKVGNFVRYRRSALDSFLATCERTSTSTVPEPARPRSRRASHAAE